MAKELADAIVEASVIMQKKEEEEAVVADAYVADYYHGRNGFVLRSTDGDTALFNGLQFSTLFSAIKKADKEGYRLMRGDAAKELLQQSRTVNIERGLPTVHALFQKKA